MTRRKTSDADRIERFKLWVDMADDEEEFVEIPKVLAVDIASLLDRVRKRRGRQPISGRDRVHENTVIALAQIRKAKLIATGMPKGKAEEEAAQWAAARLRERNLSVTTIKRLMQRRR